MQKWIILFLPPHWRQDPHILNPGDKRVPSLSRQIMGLIGLLFALFAVAGFLIPDWLIDYWVWPLTIRSARLLSGWHALLGVGGPMISREERWSSWRVPLESIGLWQLLVLIAIFVRQEDFVGSTAVNWYTASVIIILAGILGLYLFMACKPTE